VPVVQVHSIQDMPGGAANVAMNVSGLGASTTLLSLVGDDQDGQILDNMLTSSNVHCVFLRDKSLRTTVKVRVLARHKQVVRADFEQRPDHELLLPLVDMFAEQVKACNVVVFSDYGKGGLTHMAKMMEHAIMAGRAILVDPKGTDYSAYRCATCITPNRHEFSMVVGSWVSESDFERRAFGLRDHLELGSLLVTRSEDGMSLFLGSRHIRIHSQARQVFDVSGAGDTVIATMGAAIGAGMGIDDAAYLANTAAGIVVGKLGTSSITLKELEEHDC
jgi:rfaE bifunctional protein kinase chain/domain